AMQTANLIKQLGLRPKRTIRVVAWMNEENGLQGGKTYAKEHAAEIANHFAVIETDLGADHPIGINVVGKKELKDFVEPIATVLRHSGAGVVAEKEEAGSDIDPMAKLGVPNFSPIQDSRFYFTYHHTAADTLDKIDPKHLAEAAAINAVLAYALANLEQPLPR
ncbi:MAG: M28 family peptidase, partial [Chthoniobacterales bacterium]